MAEPPKKKRNYYDIKDGFCVDCFGNKWTFLEEVKGKIHFKSLCEQHGVIFLSNKGKHSAWSLTCLQRKWFKLSNGCQGFDCAYRLLFIRQNIQQQQTEEFLGYVFYENKHCHPFIPSGACEQISKLTTNNF